MIRSLPLLLLSVCIFAFLPFSVFAQGVPQGVNISITSEPKFPEPFSPTKLTLEAYGTAVLDENIVWYVNGIEFNADTRSITFTSGNIGSSTHVVAMVTQGANSFSVETTIIPSLLSIILESSAPTSPFSKEKTGIPAEMPFTAIATLDRGEKKAQYTYRWEIGEGNTGTTAGQRAIFTMPMYESLLFVTVMNENGVVVHQGGVNLVPTDPVLAIYPYQNAVASHFPLASTYIPLTDTESFLAVVRNGSNATPQWFLNEIPLTNLENPYLLTLGQLLNANAQLRLQLPYGPFNTLIAEKIITIKQ